MNTQVYNKIKKRLEFIQHKCFELSILEYQFSLLQMSEKVSTSGDVEKLKRRLQNDRLLNDITSKSIMDKFFLELAKVFETASRDEGMSYPNLQKIIEKNYMNFNKNTQQKINEFIVKAGLDLNIYSDKISNIIEHRNKCLGHNDKRLICGHLSDMNSGDTKSIIEILIKFTNSLSDLFGYKMFPSNQLEETKQILSSNAYERIRKMEKD